MPTRRAMLPVDVVVLQRPEELDGLAERWLGGRRPGRDVPAVYLEHNAPQGRIAEMVHPAADRSDLTVVHVTHFNDLFWDCGSTPTVVIEHGIVDPGRRYTGELARSAVVINEPGRRGRVTGTDLLAALRERRPGRPLRDRRGRARRDRGPAPSTHLHASSPGGGSTCIPSAGRRSGCRCSRPCTSACQWSPLATTEVVDAVPADAGVVSTSVEQLVDGDPPPARPILPKRRSEVRRHAAPRCVATASAVSCPTGTRSSRRWPHDASATSIASRSCPSTPARSPRSATSTPAARTSTWRRWPPTWRAAGWR